MPTYRLVIHRIDDVTARAAVAMASLRFPEIAFGPRSGAGQADATGSEDARENVLEHWDVRAPAPSHLQRWADAAGLSIVEISGTHGATAAADPPLTPLTQHSPRRPSDPGRNRP